MFMKMPVELITQKVTITYCLLGVVGNLLSLSLSLSKQLRKNPTFIIIVFASIINILSLISTILFTFNIQDLNIEICRVVIIVTFCGFQSSIFFLVIIIE
jgi:hypothetical protein